jgi:type I restriction enzyme S subunit
MINELPQDWKWVKLGNFCDVVTGTTPPKSNSSNYGNDIPFFKPPHLWDGIISETEEMLSLEGSKKARVIPPNTVLVTCIGNLGRTGLVRRKAAFNQQINAILENENIIGRFIFYQAQSPSFKNQLEKLATGTTVSIVNKSNFETINIPLPPLPTQQAIVAKIEELFSELDKGIEQLKTAQQQIKTYRQSVLKWAFEGKLTSLNHDSFDLVDEYDLNTNNQGNPDNHTNHRSDKSELPKGWKWVKLKEIAKDISDGDHQAPPKSNTGVPFITISNVNKENNKINFSDTFSVSEEYFKKLKINRKPLKGDVLYTVTGSFGIPILIDFEKDFCFQRHIGLVRPLETTNQKWLYYLLQSPDVFNQAKSTATGTAQKTVALNSLRNFEVPYCKIEEQHQIVQAIESRLSVADKLEESIAQSLQQSEALRQSILKKAFEGRLV